MVTPLLDTKLYAPRPQRSGVARKRLSDRLRRGTESRLTLVSAPAGFGKSTLLAEFAAAASHADRCIAWVSLDVNDNDAAVFFRYLITALDRAAPGIGTDARSLLEAPDRSVHVVLTTLLNDLAAFSRDIVLVLDDYHVIDARDISEAMAFFIEHLPSNIHVVLGTRADPALPLARLRAKGDLSEIRAADLRFSADEATAYLNGTMGLSLTDPDVAALAVRTEGWIAALQLAGLSLQGRENAADFIAGFAGDDRYVVDFLAEEVLLRQSDHVREFLLRTSILDRMSGPLTDAVTGDVDGGATLEALERSNLFLVPLDDRRRWYRFHHLFADVLRARLLDDLPDLVPELHRRASDWFAKAGERPEAIRHALAARDFDRAADLIELAGPEMQRGRQETTMRAWFESLPLDLFRTRPALSLGYAGALLATGQVDGVEPLLQAAERALAAPDEMVVAEPGDVARLPSALARYRAALALIAGDPAGTVGPARQAVELAVADDHLARGAGEALLGLAHWTTGDLEAAYRSFADGMVSLERGGYIADVVGGAVTLADIRLAQGRLGDAMRIYERGLALATATKESVLRGGADMHVGMAEVLLERNDLAGATEHLQASDALGEANGLPKHPWRSRVITARLRLAHGDVDGALALLDEAERRYVGDFSPNVRPVPAVRARTWIAVGRLAEASAWAREHRLSATQEPRYLREFEHLVLARLLLAQGMRTGADTVRDAAALAERLLVAAEDGRRYGSAIEILAVLALARHALGDAAGALASLDRAVSLAEPEGYLRVFIDEGPPMTSLLHLAAKRRSPPEHVRRLLAAAGEAAARPAGDERLIEPLSERELEVLRLLQSDLDGPEIALELVVSLNTLRTHTKNIYGKLGVTSRRAAVRRALELELLARP